MLVLSRFVGEEIVVDLRPHGLGLLTIMVSDIRYPPKERARAKIAIEADERLSVDRKEIFEKRERGAA